MLRTGDGVVVASEPYDDDPRWADVPDHHLVDVTGRRVTITDLEAAECRARPASRLSPGGYLADAARATSAPG